MERRINVPGKMKVRKTELKLAFDARIAVREYLTIAILHESVRVGTVETACQSSRGRVTSLVDRLVYEIVDMDIRYCMETKAILTSGTGMTEIARRC
jgi:hypothetical protein